MKPRFNNIPKGDTLQKMFSSSGSNTTLLLLVGGVVLLIGVIYMLVQTRSSHEGFEAPLEWDHDKEVMVVFHKMKGCPHCDDFQTVWDEVYDIVPGEVRSKKNKTCKMVTVAPGHPLEKTSAPVNGFPTLRVYKTPADYVEFNGHRTKEEVVDFILKNA
jgi:hypothetical protein